MNSCPSKTRPKLPKVGQTGVLTALWRHVETENPNGIINDPLARKVLDKFLPKTTEDKLRRNTSLKVFIDMIAIRTRCIDDLLMGVNIQDTVEDHESSFQFIKHSQIVLLGAGMDTRAYRLPLDKNTKFIEIDFPDVIVGKKNLFKEEKPNVNLVHVTCDISNAKSLSLCLQQHLDVTKPATIVCEGIMEYLSLQSHAMLFATLHQILPEHSQLIMFHLNRCFGEWSKSLKFGKWKQDIFFNSDKLVEFSKKHGWSKVPQIYDSTSIAKKYNRQIKDIAGLIIMRR